MPYVKWISERDRASQFILVFIAIPLSLGFLYEIAELMAKCFWEFGWKGVFWLFLIIGLIWCMFNDNN